MQEKPQVVHETITKNELDKFSLLNKFSLLISIFPQGFFFGNRFKHLESEKLNIKETREHREEFAIINNLPALKLEYEPVDWSKKGKYFVINVEKPRRVAPIDLSGKLTKSYRHSQKNKVN